jgi:GrpB-like predicted nucleotidyltransferase (UPF0157 family)
LRGVHARQERGLEDKASNDPIEKRVRKVIIGEIEPQNIVVVDYDPAWPERFRREEARIRSSLGEAALSVEHIGFTSVPGLAAKPIVDVLLVVEDSGDEPSYLPALEAAGYVLRVREPDFEIRQVRGSKEGATLLSVMRSSLRPCPARRLLPSKLPSKRQRKGA